MYSSKKCMKVIIHRVINFHYFCPRNMDAVGLEAADGVSDGRVKKLGKGMSPTNTVGTIFHSISEYP